MSDDSGQSSNGTDHAEYECRCGSSIKFSPDEFSSLVWLKNRFGYRNIDQAITDIRECCERPQYTEITAKRTVRTESDQPEEADHDV